MNTHEKHESDGLACDFSLADRRAVHVQIKHVLAAVRTGWNGQRRVLHTAYLALNKRRQLALTLGHAADPHHANERHAALEHARTAHTKQINQNKDVQMCTSMRCAARSRSTDLAPHLMVHSSGNGNGFGGGGAAGGSGGGNGGEMPSNMTGLMKLPLTAFATNVFVGVSGTT